MPYYQYFKISNEILWPTEKCYCYILASKMDPEAELKYMQDLFEHSFLHRELNVKYDSAERVLESVKRTGHNTGYATN